MNDKEKWRKEQDRVHTIYGVTMLRPEQTITITNYDEPRQTTMAERAKGQAHRWYQETIRWANDRVKGDST